MPKFEHKPVLLTEVLEYLNLQPGCVVADCTAGGGGHSEAIIKEILPGGRLIALDQDNDAVEAVKERLKTFGADTISVVQANFINLKAVLQELGIKKIDGVLYDLGVSSYQLDAPERGFSYKNDAPLDMRMNKEAPLSAYDLISQASQEELSRIIYSYGEERWAKRIAAFIVQEREKEAIETTQRLVEIIKMAIPKGARQDGPHPAKRTFQALRIAVNRELEILEEALEQGIEVLNPGGRIVVISFHSLEDRIAKEVFQRKAKGCTCPKELPVCVCNNKPVVKIMKRKPILPGAEELENNPRSRSAKMRAAQKL